MENRLIWKKLENQTFPAKIISSEYVNTNNNAVYLDAKCYNMIDGSEIDYAEICDLS